jgi:hypothetical protein
MSLFDKSKASKIQLIQAYGIWCDDTEKFIYVSTDEKQTKEDYKAHYKDDHDYPLGIFLVNTEKGYLTLNQIADQDFEENEEAMWDDFEARGYLVPHLPYMPLKQEKEDMAKLLSKLSKEEQQALRKHFQKEEDSFSYY